MFTKRLLAGLLAVLLCFALVACNDTLPKDTTSGSTSDEKNTTSQSTSDSTSESTSGSDSSNPATPAEIYDLEKVSVGKYVTLRYNANAVDVTYEAKKGVGSKENVTITVAPKNGYTFDGFTQTSAIVNGQPVISSETTYTFTASDDTTIFVNSSFNLTYHANGGELAGGFSGEDTFSAIYFLNPITLHENGSFEREGYTLIGYNTKEDGSGEYVTLGGRVNAYGQGAIDLWCVWAEDTPADQFTYTASGDSVTITGYSGSDETVTIPETIDGKTVTKIASGAFLNNSTVKTIVVAKTVKNIDRNAFNYCSALESVILWDAAFSGSSWSGASISDSCIKNCNAFKSVYLNTVYKLTNEWFSCGAAKFDRLMWAKDKKKIIIIGGSGSLYGYDCAVIDEALNGDYEIINLGENANITSLMYFDIVEDFITEGDIVLWCPEPGNYTLGSDTFSSRLWNFRKSDYCFMQYLDLSYYSNFFSSFASNCSTLAGSKFKNFDSLSPNMSKYGDDLSPRETKGQLYDYSFGYYLTEDLALDEIFTNIQSKGGKVFFSFAAMQESGFESVRISDIEYYEEMITELTGVVSISEYENCVYANEYFWDSPWHMTDEGAAIRSERVAQDILKALGKID